MSEIPAAALQLQSTVRSDATVELALVDVPVPEPNDEEVLVRIEAAPINPSDMGALFGPADLETARASGRADRPVITVDIPPALMEAMAGRLDQPLPAGNEGAGIVVKAGASAQAQALLSERRIDISALLAPERYALSDVVELFARIDEGIPGVKHVVLPHGEPASG